MAATTSALSLQRFSLLNRKYKRDLRIVKHNLLCVFHLFLLYIKKILVR